MPEPYMKNFYCADDARADTQNVKSDRTKERFLTCAGLPEFAETINEIKSTAADGGNKIFIMPAKREAYDALDERGDYVPEALQNLTADQNEILYVLRLMGYDVSKSASQFQIGESWYNIETAIVSW